ncbi:hypothetical protein GGTG_05993 [Gaeumannomyces tritici R3-111a-1]|uniref:Uncharacterized protein n=1 Tax=Gaeumannomyces tritici (strain R3-111a-1) TaxID=644352 RepID=J3NXI7_GAET3|nr:hypothetical protein GGTG_05993 [Gaeumannomyces tritici R3-111a-1]EJT76069.1 hypothetical protein GGTG_05993 [Gaeumannomyces tritici R3-111a-1]
MAPERAAVRPLSRAKSANCNVDAWGRGPARHGGGAGAGASVEQPAMRIFTAGLGRVTGGASEEEKQRGNEGCRGPSRIRISSGFYSAIGQVHAGKRWRVNAAMPLRFARITSAA